MSDGISPAAYVNLGQNFYILMNSDRVNVDVLNPTVPSFIEWLETCGLKQTRVAAQPLTQIATYPYNPRTRHLTPVAGHQMTSYMASISETMFAELECCRLVAIDRDAVSGELRELSSRIQMDETQLRLWNETVLCLESGAYRASAVMGWNLAYEIIRRWVWNRFSDRFNNALEAQWLRRDGTATYRRIDSYEEFYLPRAPGERVVVDTCFHAQLFGERLRDDLRHHLRRRNDYAHPSFRSPSAEQCNAYLHDLIEIITNEPFQQQIV